MAELIQLDPSFESLLREVVATRGSLSRIPRSDEVPRWLASEVPSRTSEPRLTVAERELLRVGRHEIAWLLRQAAMRELDTGERTRREVTREMPARCEAIQLDRDAIGIEAGAEGTAEYSEPEANRLLRSWLSSETSERPTAAALAAMSMRFVPTAHARAISGLDYALRGHLASAEEWLLACLRSDPTSERSGPTWSNLSLTYSRQGRIGEALAANRRALSVAPTSFVASAGVLLCGVILEDAAVVRQASLDLERHHKTNHGAIHSYIQTLRHQRQRGVLAVSYSALGAAKRNAAEFEVARRILDALA